MNIPSQVPKQNASFLIAFNSAPTLCLLLYTFLFSGAVMAIHLVSGGYRVPAFPQIPMHHSNPTPKNAAKPRTPRFHLVVQIVSGCPMRGRAFLLHDTPPDRVLIFDVFKSWYHSLHYGSMTGTQWQNE